MIGEGGDFQRSQFLVVFTDERLSHPPSSLALHNPPRARAAGTHDAVRDNKLVGVLHFLTNAGKEEPSLQYTDEHHHRDSERSNRSPPLEQDSTSSAFVPLSALQFPGSGENVKKLLWQGKRYCRIGSVVS